MLGLGSTLSTPVASQAPLVSADAGAGDGIAGEEAEDRGDQLEREDEAEQDEAELERVGGAGAEPAELLRGDEEAARRERREGQRQRHPDRPQDDPHALGRRGRDRGLLTLALVGHRYIRSLIPRSSSHTLTG